MRSTLQLGRYFSLEKFSRKSGSSLGLFGLLTLFLFAGTFSAQAQIYLNEFTGTANCPTNGNVPTMASNATGTALTRTTIACATAGNVFNSSGLNLTASVNNSSYIEFSVSAAAGYKLNITSLSFFRQGSNTAPRQLEVRYSTNAFATSSTSWGAAPNTPSSGTVATWDMTDFSTAAGGTVTFRFYPYGTTSVNNGTPAAGGTFRLDDVTVNGTVTQDTNPTVNVTGTLAAVNTVYGTASATPTHYTVSGSDLSANLVITAPSGFEISKNGAAGTYAGTQTIAPVSNAIAATDIYVRLAASTPVGTYSGNITNVSGTTSANAATVASTVSPKALTLLNATASNKVYDRTAAATITGTLDGVVGSDNVSFIGTGTFNSIYVANGIGVTPSVSLTGSSALNYTFTQPSGLTANITAAPLTVADAEAQNKVADGNANTTITGTLVGVINPDDVTFNGTGTFAQTTAGMNLPVTSTSTLGGAQASNYSLVQPTGLTANIYAQALTPQTITFGAVADAVYGSANFNLTATASSGLTVAYESSNTNVATVSGNTVTITGVGTTTITASQAGNGTYEEAPEVSQTFTVTPKALTIDGAVANDKIYDGNNTATFTGTLNGIVGSDVVTLDATGTFAGTTVANNITVTSTATLGGADASNYTLTQPVALSADITPKALVATTSANNKVYDATTAVTLNAIVLDGVVPGDEVAAEGTGAFASEDVANNINVTTSITLTGADAFNYTVNNPTVTANITPATLVVSGISALDKVYDATNAATLFGTASVSAIGSDNVSVNGTATGTFNNENVATGKPVTVSGLSLVGPDAGNYTLAYAPIAADITVASLTIANAQAQNKTFDGTNAAVITGTLQGVLGTDAVTLVGTGTFAQTAAGTNIAVTSTATLSGVDAPNYVINPQPTGLTATILPGPSILAPGDLAIIGYNVNTPDNFAWVSWVDIEPNTYIKFTDNPFLSSGSANLANNVRGGEQFVIWRNNTGAVIPAGTVITISDAPATNVGTIVSGALNGLAGAGDNIFAYQGAATSGATPDFTSNANPTTFNGTILFGLSTSPWLATGATVNTNNSFLPSQLNVPYANIALTGNPTRGQFTAARNSKTSLADYKAEVTNPANWTTATGSGTITLNTTAFTLAQGPSASELFGIGPVCNGSPANLYVFVTGGLAPFTVVYTDGTNEFTVNNFNSGSAIIVSPTTTTTYTLVSVTDANGLAGSNNTGEAFIEVQNSYDFYVDNDGDGYGTGTAVSLCAADANTPPTGYALNNTDCDDNNGAVYQSATLYVDFDGDGYSSNVPAVVCYGATIPAGYVAAPTLLDCNDEVFAINPGHAEVLYNGVDDNCDGQLDEGFQITTKLLQSSCGATLASISSLIGIQTIAPGSAYTGWRIRATNGSQVQTIETNVPHFVMTQFPSYAYATTYTIEIELQRNGIWLGYYGQPCLVSTPAILEEGGAAAVSGAQCGQTLPKINTLIATTSIPGVTGYRFRVTNLTDASGPYAEQVVTRGVNWFTLQMLTRYNFGTTYRIEVAVKTNGDFGGYGAPCQVTSPSAPSLINCAATAASMSQNIAATSVQGATQYRFQITRSSDGASTSMDRGVNYFTFNQVPTNIFTAGAEYYVRVAVMTTGYWSPFGDICTVIAPGGVAKGETAGEASAQDITFKATAYPNPFASGFAIELASAAQDNVSVKVYDMLGKLLDNQNAPAADLNVTKIGANYPAGVYNVVVTQGENVRTLRVIKR